MQPTQIGGVHRNFRCSCSAAHLPAREQFSFEEQRLKPGITPAHFAASASRKCTASQRRPVATRQWSASGGGAAVPPRRLDCGGRGDAAGVVRRPRVNFPSPTGLLFRRPPCPFKLADDGVSERLEMLWDQCEAVFLCGLTQLLVPAGEVDVFAGREGERPAKVDGVVGAQ